MDKTLSIRIEALTESAQKSMKKLGDASEKAGHKINGSLGKLLKGLIGVTSAYRAVTKAISSYLSQDAELQAKINATWTALGAMLAPIISTIADVANTVIEFLNAFIKAVTGANLLEKAMQKSASSAKSIKGSLAGFDEINNLSSGGSTSSYSWTDYLDANIAFETLYAKMESAKEEAVKWLNGIEENAKDFISRIKFLSDETGKFLTKGVELFFSGVKKSLDGAYNLVKGVLELIIGIFSGDVDKIMASFQTIWNGLKKLLDGALQTVIGVLTSISGIVVEIGSAIKAVVMAVVNWVVNSFNSVKSGVVKVFNGIWDVIKGILNKIISGFESMVNACIRGLNKLLAPLRNIGNTILSTIGLGRLSLSEISTISLPRLASGGFVDKGQLFIANEQGPELVGSMNGRTAVANQNQIIEGIKQGVMEAMASSSGSMTVNLTLDGQVLTKKVVNGIKAMNRQMGGSVL